MAMALPRLRWLAFRSLWDASSPPTCFFPLFAALSPRLSPAASPFGDDFAARFRPR